MVVVEQGEGPQHRLGARQGIARPLDLQRERSAECLPGTGRIPNDIRYAVSGQFRIERTILFHPKILKG